MFSKGPLRINLLRMVHIFRVHQTLGDMCDNIKLGLRIMYSDATISY